MSIAAVTRHSKANPTLAKKWTGFRLGKHHGHMGGHVQMAMSDIWEAGDYLRFQQSGAKRNVCSVHPAGGNRRWQVGPLFCHIHDVAFDRGEECPCKGQYNVKRHILPLWWRAWDRLKTMARGKFNGPIIEQS